MGIANKLGVTFVVVLAVAAAAAGRATAAGLRPEIGPTVRPTQFRGDVRKLPRGNVVPRERERPSGPNDQPGAPVSDPALQSRGAQAAAPSPSSSFAGLDFAGWGAGWPPDTNGDVGPDYYVQTVNTSVGIFDKRTGTRVAAFTFNSLFSQAATGTPCDSQNQGDPVAVYDPIGDRWIVSDFAWSNYTSGAMYQCMAVSKTSDPVAGGWWFYAWQTATGGSLTDYPKLGVWPDGIYMSANMFSTAPGGSYQNAKVWAFNRTAMEAGQPAQSVAFTLPKTANGITIFGLLPSNARSVTGLPPAGAPNYFTSIWGAYAIRVWKFHVDWQTPASSTFTGPTNSTVSAFNPPPDTVPERDGNALDTLSYRLMMQNQYTNLGGTESLWLTHTVATGGVARIRWYQLPVTGGQIAASPLQQSTWGPDSSNRFLPSLAVDRNGDMAVGYSVSSAAMYPAIRYAGRLVGDPANTLGQGENSLIEGTGFQCCTFSDSSLNQRWGDYSAMTIDPDGCTFWYTSEYYDTKPTTLLGDNWKTRIGSFRLPGCSSSGYHSVDRVGCSTASPRFTVAAPAVYGYDPLASQFVLWRTLFAHNDGAAWSVVTQTPFLVSTATATLPAQWWFDLNGTFVASSSNLVETADGTLSGDWAALQQTLWANSAGALVQSDLQLVATPTGAAAQLGTPICSWAGTPATPSVSPFSLRALERQTQPDAGVIRRAIRAQAP